MKKINSYLKKVSIVSLFGLLFLTFFSSCEKKETPTAHFVYGLWDTKPLSEDFARTIELWQQLGWNIKLWDKQQVEALLESPGNERLSHIYNNLTRNVQKADLARYLIVLKEGGFYFDLDCRPTPQANLSKLIQLAKTHDVFFVETVTSESFAASTAEIYPIRRGVPECQVRIANYAFGARKNSPALKYILDLLCERCEKNHYIYDDYDVLFTTGPDCVTEALHGVHPDTYHIIQDSNKYIIHSAAGTWRDDSDIVYE